MKAITTCLFAISLLAGTASLAVPASAQPATPAPGVKADTMPTDVSTAKRKRHAHHRAYYGPPAYGQWHAGNPNYGPGTPQLRAYQRRGACVIDEGYGRYSACSNW